MDRNSLVLMISVLMAGVIVFIVLAFVVVNLPIVPVSVSGTTPPLMPTPGTAITLWHEYIKQSIIPVGAVLAALITGLFGYRNIMRQLRTTTRNDFLDMIVDNSTYKSELSSFLSALSNGNFDDLRNRLDCDALFFLFVLKPDIEQKLREAIKEGKNISQVKKLTQQLLTI